jgi:hypothetical protein
MWMLALGSPEGSECPPVALLEGDLRLVRRVRAELAGRGIRFVPIEGCESFRVALAARGAEVSISIIGDRGTQIARAARDPNEAATIIESWARTDITAPLLEHELPPDVRQPLDVPETRASSAIVPEPPRPPRLFVVSAAGVSGIGSDRSVWVGFDAHGCARVWELCMGGAFEYAIDVGVSGDSDRLETERSLFSLLATAELPWLLGDIELIPGIGAGLGIVPSEREVGLQDVIHNALGLRLRGQLGVAGRVDRLWSVRADLGLDVAPFGESESLRNVSGREERIAIAGEPKLMGWLRFSLELGGI